MFTGIVGEMGTVKESHITAAGRRLVLQAGHTVEGLALGDSIAVNGVCLTAVAVSPGIVAVDVVEETLHRSNLGALGPGAQVNLERPMAADGRFDGHIVQGHVDAVGTIVSMHDEGDALRVRIATTPELMGFVVEKGSITVDGVSLTVTAISPRGDSGAWFEIVLIPHTLEVTTLGIRQNGDQVNLEIDVIAKYVAKHVETLMEAR